MVINPAEFGKGGLALGIFDPAFPKLAQVIARRRGNVVGLFGAQKLAAENLKQQGVHGLPGIPGSLTNRLREGIVHLADGDLCH
jgi:hypothetical protein